MVVERIARRWNVVWRNESPALRVGEGHIAAHSVRLVEPLMFMNRSGHVLSRCLTDPDDALLVVCDDLDLPEGQIRVRRRGGAGGHRGIASIVEHVGPEFARVRVGIGRPPTGGEAADHVLQPLTATELAALHPTVERASDAVEYIIVEGSEAAMNRFNVRTVPATE
jgi:PTH1 family peptidyl-tRNA hydrolase